jgi:hypothetical protein
VDCCVRVEDESFHGRFRQLLGVEGLRQVQKAGEIDAAEQL